MEMAENQPATWRDSLAWTAVGVAICALVMLGAVALFQDGGLGELFAGEAPVEVKAVVSLTAAVILGATVIGFSQRNMPFGPRALRSFALTNVLAIGIFGLAVWVYQALTGMVSNALRVSETAALVLGLALCGLALLCVGVVAAAHARASLLTPEQEQDTREQGRVTIYSAIWMAVTGLTLVLLTLAGPGGIVSSATALLGSIALLAISAVVTFAIWPRLDELSQAISREAGNAAFYLVFIIGGGWAVLAHLGFVRPATPLDWLTLLILSSFAASFIALGRRGLLKPR
jgi:hypothetical protein